jgi:O-antigen ligase
MNRYRFSFFAFTTYLICSLTAMATMSLGFVVLLLAWMTSFSRKWKFLSSDSSGTPEFKNYRFWAVTLWIACWSSLIAARFFPYAYAGHDPEVTAHGFLKIWYLLIPGILLGVYQTASEKIEFTWSKILTPWWVMTLLLCGIAFIQFFYGWPHRQDIPTNPGRFHATLFFGHHLSTSSIIIFPAFTALAISIGHWVRQKKTNIYGLSLGFITLAGISGVLILFLSYARTAWLALLIGFALLAVHYLGKKLSWKQWLATILASIAALGIFSQTELVKERITRMMGVYDRFELWKVNIEFFKVRPWTGIGWLKTQEMTTYYFDHIDPQHLNPIYGGHAHSNFFEMLGGTGLIGLLAFLGWSYFTIRLAHRLQKRFNQKGDWFLSDLCFGIFVALILLHFNGLTNVTFWEGKVMHQQMLAVGFLLILDHRLNQKKH